MWVIFEDYFIDIDVDKQTWKNVCRIHRRYYRNLIHLDFLMKCKEIRYIPRGFKRSYTPVTQCKVVFDAIKDLQYLDMSTYIETLRAFTKKDEALFLEYWCLLETSLAPCFLTILEEKLNYIKDRTISSSSRKKKLKYPFITAYTERKKIIDWTSTITPEEKDFLSLGKSFRVMNRVDNIVDDSIAETEKWLEKRPHLNGSSRAATRSMVFNKLWNLKSSDYKDNLNGIEREGLEKIRRRRNVKFLKADKGGAIVCVNKDYYEDAKRTFLADGSTFVRTRFNALLGAKSTRTKWLNQYHIKRDIPSKEVAPSLILFPKVHKKEKAWRPVVSSRHSPLRVVEAVLSPLLKKLVRPNITNSFDVIKRLNNLVLDKESNYLFGSLDIISMYPSLSRDLLKFYLGESLRKNNTLSDQERDMVRTGVDLCLRQDFLEDKGIFYKIKKGIGIGSSISPILGEIYLNSWEEKYIHDPAHKNPSVVLWLRYIDDVLLLWSDTKEELEVFIRNLNSYDESLQFTFTVDDRIQYLDINISLSKDNIFYFSWHHKDCWVGSLTHMRSDTSLRIKRNIAYSFYKRVIKLNNYHLNKSDLKEVREVLLDRGFPMHMINGIYFDVINKFFDKSLFVKSEERKPDFENVFCIDSNIGMNRLDWSFLNVPPDIIKKGGIPLLDFINKKMVPFKCNTFDISNNEGLVYSVSCMSSPNRKYIGETKRLLKYRIKEHKRSVENMEIHSNALAWHADLTTHLPNWNDIRILYKEEDLVKRKVLEAIVIKRHMVNDKSLINISKGYELNEFWTALF